MPKRVVDGEGLWRNDKLHGLSLGSAALSTVSMSGSFGISTPAFSHSAVNSQI
jgi:hypothetical protein